MATSVAAIAEIITVSPTLLSGRVVPEEGVKLDVDMAGAVPYIRRHIFKELRTCQFSLFLGKVELVDAKASATGAEIHDGATPTIVRTKPSEDQWKLWREFEKSSRIMRRRKISSGCCRVWLCKDDFEKIGLPCLEMALKETRVDDIGLISCSLGDDEAEIIAEVLKTSKDIKCVSLRYNNISDIGAVEIGQALATNRSIKMIDLGHNKISDIGAVGIGKALAVNNTLRRLFLEDNNIQDDGAKAIAQAVRVNTGLRAVQVTKNLYGDIGRDDLQKAAKTRQLLGKPVDIAL